MGDTDLAFKTFAEQVPRALAWLLLGEARRVRPVATPVRWTERTGDFAGIVEPRTARAHLLHVEFESGRPAGVVLRLQIVNGLLLRKYRLPVLSAVVKLRGRGPRLRWREAVERLPEGSLAGGHPTRAFWWLEVNCRSFAPEDFLEGKELGALPLVPLTEGGDRAAVLARAADRIAHEAKGAERAALLGAFFVAAGLRRVPLEIIKVVRSSMGTRNWFIDMVRAESKKEALAEGEKKGLVKGEKKGLIKGEKKGLVKGEKKGLVKGFERTLEAILTQRFGRLSRPQRDHLVALCERSRAVARLTKAALAAEDLTDFFARASAKRRKTLAAGR